MTGLLLVDKPEGVTSAGVIRQLKRVLGPARVGHLGTLDPFASGLLPLCLGEATKAARWLLLEEKAYTGVIRLGSETDTLDRTGRTTRTADVPVLDAAAVQAAVAGFTGPIRQVPPMFSALKRDGVPLHVLARKGVDVAREARDVVIHGLTVEIAGPGRLAFAVRCSKGTYVRVLAEDLGRALGTAAHLETLRRTAVGRFRVEDAWAVDALAAWDPERPLPVVPLREALGEVPAFVMAEAAVARLRLGQQGVLAALPPPPAEGAGAVAVDPAGTVHGLLEGHEGGWRLARLLLPE